MAIRCCGWQMSLHLSIESKVAAPIKVTRPFCSFPLCDTSFLIKSFRRRLNWIELVQNVTTQLIEYNERKVRTNKKRTVQTASPHCNHWSQSGTLSLKLSLACVCFPSIYFCAVSVINNNTKLHHSVSVSISVSKLISHLQDKWSWLARDFGQFCSTFKQ